MLTNKKCLELTIKYLESLNYKKEDIKNYKIIKRKGIKFCFKVKMKDGAVMLWTVKEKDNNVWNDG